MPNKIKRLTATFVYKNKTVRKKITTTVAHGMISELNKNPNLVSIYLDKSNRNKKKTYNFKQS